MAQQKCIESEGFLAQIDGDNEQQFMVNYMHITGLRKLTNVSTNYVIALFSICAKLGFYK